jgi:hypothetical protein
MVLVARREHFGGSLTPPNVNTGSDYSFSAGLPFNSTRMRSIGLPRTVAFHARARDPHFSRSLLRSDNFLLQHCAIQRNATRISLVLLTSEKQTAQHRENLRKNSLGNYKSAALNQLSYAGILIYESRV